MLNEVSLLTAEKKYVKITLGDLIFLPNTTPARLYRRIHILQGTNPSRRLDVSFRLTAFLKGSTHETNAT